MSNPGNSQRQQRMFFSFFLDRTEGDLELRAMTWNPDLSEHGGYEKPRGLCRRDMSELIEFASNQPGDAFMGVNTRKPGVLNANKKQILEITCIAVDVDFKRTSREKLERALASFCFKPTLVIFSGNGWHIYWLLTSPVLRTDETEAYFEQAGKSIAKMLGGDHTHDVTRILRVPGRVNSKWPDLPMCRIISHHGPFYDAENFERFIDGDVSVPTTRAAKPVTKIKPAAKIPDRFMDLLKRDGKVRGTWNGDRLDLKDQSRSGFDQSMSSLLARRGYTPAEVAAVLRGMASGKGVNAHSAYVNLTIEKAFAPSPNARRYPSADRLLQRYREKETLRGVEAMGEGLRETVEVEGPSMALDSDEEIEGFIKWACRESRKSAERAKRAGRWQDATFHFLRLLKGRKEFASMSQKDLEKSGLWQLTEFSTEEVFNGCAAWPKVVTSATENKLEDALILAKVKPLESCKRWADYKPYMLFLSFIFYFQQLSGGKTPVFLPCRKVAEMLEVDAMTVSRFRQMALSHGFLIEVEKAKARRATRFKVNLDKFQSPETLH